VHPVHRTKENQSRPIQTEMSNRAKILQLETTSFRYLLKSFIEWLDILGYSPKTLKYATATIRELLWYMERKEVNHIKQLDSEILRTYYNDYLTQRPNKSRSGGLSNHSLNNHITFIRKFLEYLREVGRLPMPQVPFKLEKTTPRTVYLTVEEIQLLFKTTYEPSSLYRDMEYKAQHLSARDRAMLAVYYGCGLRRNEGINLTVSDINFDKALLHVRIGKKKKQRFVPISKASLKYLQEYIYDHRGELLQGSKSEQLFIGKYQKPLSSQSLIIRLKGLQYRSGDITLQEKEIGLHTLRHSIATHLLAGGMSLENISTFLGHSSLESTQVYTHLTSEALGEGGLSRTANQPFNNIPKYEPTQLAEDE